MSMDESCITSRYSSPLGSPTDERRSSSIVYNTNMVSNAGSNSYSRCGNDVSTQEIGWDHGDFSPKENQPFMIRWKSGKKVDQRLLVLLKTFFRELNVKRNEFYKKIFPEVFDEFINVFKKIGAMLSNKNNQTKHRTMQRNVSLGPPRSDEMRLDWFKVKTPDVIVAEPGGQDGNSGTTNSTVSYTDPK